MKTDYILIEQAVKLLESKIAIIKKGYQDDYTDGVIDGLIIAIKTIEN